MTPALRRLLDVRLRSLPLVSAWRAEPFEREDGIREQNGNIGGFNSP
jgi:hypothetical protein